MNPENNSAPQNNAASEQRNGSPENILSTVPNATRRMIFGILSYLGILVVISFIFGRDDSFVKFHVKQGLVLLCIDIVVWILGATVWQIWPILSIVNLAVLVYSIIGIVYVVQHKETGLPWIGQFAKYFTF